MPAQMDVLDDAEVRELYLGYVRAGLGPHQASQLIGLREFQVRRYVAKHPDFAEFVADALGQATEPVIQTAYALALAGNEKMIALWLSANAPEKYGAKPTSVTNNILVTGDERMLAELRASLEARQRELDAGVVIAVESSPA